MTTNSNISGLAAFVAVSLFGGFFWATHAGEFAFKSPQHFYFLGEPTNQLQAGIVLTTTNLAVQLSGKEPRQRLDAVIKNLSSHSISFYHAKKTEDWLEFRLLDSGGSPLPHQTATNLITQFHVKTNVLVRKWSDVGLTKEIVPANDELVLGVGAKTGSGFDLGAHLFGLYDLHPDGRYFLVVTHHIYTAGTNGFLCHSALPPVTNSLRVLKANEW